MNAWLRIRRIDFRVYVHPTAPMVKLAASAGFRSTDVHRAGLWVSMVLARG